MPVGVGEITVIARPKRSWPLASRLRAGGFGPCHYRIDLAVACDILCNGDVAIAVPNRAGLPILALRLATPQCEHDTASLEEAHALLACPLRLHEAEAFVEGDRFGYTFTPSVMRVTLLGITPSLSPFDLGKISDG